MIPIELFCKIVCCYSGQFSISNYPELVDILNKSPDKDVLFHIEETSAAKGPLVLWYPLSKWEEEKRTAASIDRLLAAQYKSKDPIDALIKRMEVASKLRKQIQEAEEKGLTQIAESLKSVLTNL